jgi:hypothetical protein
MICSMGSSCRYKRFLFSLGCSNCASTTFFPHCTPFQFLCPCHPPRMGRQSCRIACLLLCVSNSHPATCLKILGAEKSLLCFLLLCHRCFPLYICTIVRDMKNLFFAIKSPPPPPILQIADITVLAIPWVIESSMNLVTLILRGGGGGSKF